MGLPEMFLNALNEALLSIGNFLPKLIAAILILIAGWLIAHLLKFLTVRLLRLVRLDKVTEKVGVDEFLKKGGSKKTGVDIVGIMVYWMVMIIVLVAVLNTFGLTVASELLNNLILYIPNVIVALVVLLFGVFIAGLLGGAVRTACLNVGISKEDILSGLVRWAIIIFAGAIALGQLGVGERVVETAVLIILCAAGLAIGLALGLGGKDAAKELIDSIRKRKEDK